MTARTTLTVRELFDLIRQYLVEETVSEDGAVEVRVWPAGAAGATCPATMASADRTTGALTLWGRVGRPTRPDGGLRRLPSGTAVALPSDSPVRFTSHRGCAMMTMSAGQVSGIRSACLLESWVDRGCLMLRVAPRDGGGELVLRCNADAAGLSELMAAADRCLEAVQSDDRELGAGD